MISEKKKYNLYSICILKRTVGMNMYWVELR